ncbi:MAG: hypothetical protein ACRC9L_02510 [Brevinema sp.]
MKFFYFLLLLSAVACGNSTESPSQSANLPIFRLDSTQLSNYMLVLPQVLEASQAFLKTKEGIDSAKDPDNSAFYQYVFRHEYLKDILNGIGFVNEREFGIHHEYIVALYIKLSEDPDVLKDAKTILPALSKEKDVLVLRLSRDAKNSSLQKLVDEMDAKQAFYQNVQLLEPYLSFLDSLNQ